MENTESLCNLYLLEEKLPDNSGWLGLGSFDHMWEIAAVFSIRSHDNPDKEYRVYNNETREVVPMV